MLATQRPQGTAHFAQETLPLILIDAHDFIQQAEVIATLSGYRAKRQHILGKARSAVANSRIQEARPNPRIGANAMAHLVNVPTDGFAKPPHPLHQVTLHRSEPYP